MKIIGNTVGMGLPKPNLMQTDPSKGDYVAGKDIMATIEYVDGLTAELWAEIRYAPIDVLSVSNTIGTQEIGTVVQSGTVSWSLNKTPVSQTVNGKSVSVDVRSDTVGPISSTTKFTVKATDERGETDEGSTWAYFYNGVYYGTHTGTVMPTDAQLLALTKKLQSGRGLDLKGNAGVGQYLIYACPSDYGTPQFWYNGIQGGFYKLGTMLHTNKSGHEENYDVWLSESDELGTRVITVK